MLLNTFLLNVKTEKDHFTNPDKGIFLNDHAEYSLQSNRQILAFGIRASCSLAFIDQDPENGVLLKAGRKFWFSMPS